MEHQVKMHLRPNPWSNYTISKLLLARRLGVFFKESRGLSKIPGTTSLRPNTVLCSPTCPEKCVGPGQVGQMHEGIYVDISVASAVEKTPVIQKGSGDQATSPPAKNERAL